MVSFNPRPPLLAGESSLRPTTRPAGQGFNPRPPLLAGESVSAVALRIDNRVSIRARHCWRANPPLRLLHQSPRGSFNPRPPLLAGESKLSRQQEPTTDCFNPRPPLLAGESVREAWRASKVADGSIRARHCWRANPSSAAPWALAKGVSIRARHCWRANPVEPLAVALDALFQSAPAIAGGRIGACPLSCRRWWCFNPRPPLLAGESRFGAAPAVVLCVSIRARHCWRANPDHRHDAVVLVGVSIRARHCWRANRSPAGCRCTACCFNPRPPLLAGESLMVGVGVPGRWFQSAPAIAGGRITAGLEGWKKERKFQSAPAIAGGRISPTHAAKCPQACFNPRPPLLAGESLRICLWLLGTRVSIRARHCWRANPTT
mgnify:CR=1 FL=1